ncbi:MAG: CDP-diacylglycerol--glycerol-3-phosphate 3-phosphatidyltransferase [Lachnospiraceae bacterium]|nr:CDP-diacylglycerol--glycerol-3-phosphate 3-phosphatidyltransferase [Lachnospiraceae bacterium]
MNLPNKLTILRLVFIPFYVFFVMTDFFSFTSHVALVIFIIASLTDLFDGKIARKYNLITNFGKFADPLADKILVVAGMVCFVALGRLPVWVCIIILAREFAVSGFRLVVAANGTVIAASYWGKFKTTFQMIMICLMTFDMQRLVTEHGWSPVVWNVYHIVTIVIMYIALALTIISMIDYFYKNRAGFRTDK